jgi:hypothetical protein
LPLPGLEDIVLRPLREGRWTLLKRLDAEP